MSTFTRALSLPGVGPVELTFGEWGTGRTFLILHGGAGPLSVVGFAGRLATTHGVRVLAPTHPGFGGTPRPEALKSIPGLAALYAALLDELDLRDVVVVGNSIGGWIAAELALLASPRVGRVAIVDGVGIVVEGHPVADVFSMSLSELFQRSYHDPARFLINPATLTDAQRAGAAANRAALAVYGGQPSAGDATLRGRLAKVAVPTVVLWGEADRIGDPDYGRAFAAAIPGARFQLLPEVGHVPQVESPERLMSALWDFASAP